MPEGDRNTGRVDRPALCRYIRVMAYPTGSMRLTVPSF